MLKINGQVANAAGKTLQQIVLENNYDIARIAVEINGNIVPKSKYACTILSENDNVEIVSFVGGG